MPIGTGSKVLLVGGGALITFLGARAVWAATRPTRGAVEQCAPYTWNPDAVAATIDALVGQGGMTMEDVAAATANEHYGHHPGGAVVQFPPANGLAGVQCVWALVYDMTQRIWAERGPDVDYNELVSQFESGNGQPETGTFFDRRQGDNLSTVARRVLDNAGIPQSSANRIAVMRLIECSPYNDAVYNVKLSENSFKSRFRQDQPYGISGYPQHHDNLLRMKQGLPVRRAALRNSMDKHEAIPGGPRHADMWVPLLKPGTEVVGPNSVAVWQDGSSAINPPTEILALGFENVPPGEYGCAPWTTNVESL